MQFQKRITQLERIRSNLAIMNTLNSNFVATKVGEQLNIDFKNVLTSSYKMENNNQEENCNMRMVWNICLFSIKLRPFRFVWNNYTAGKIIRRTFQPNWNDLQIIWTNLKRLINSSIWNSNWNILNPKDTKLFSQRIHIIIRWIKSFDSMGTFPVVWSLFRSHSAHFVSMYVCMYYNSRQVIIFEKRAQVFNLLAVFNFAHFYLGLALLHLENMGLRCLSKDFIWTVTLRCSFRMYSVVGHNFRFVGTSEFCLCWCVC